jgi:hypothetical protein
VCWYDAQSVEIASKPLISVKALTKHSASIAKVCVSVPSEWFCSGSGESNRHDQTTRGGTTDARSQSVSRGPDPSELLLKDRNPTPRKSMLREAKLVRNIYLPILRPLKRAPRKTKNSGEMGISSLSDSLTSDDRRERLNRARVFLLNLIDLGYDDSWCDDLLDDQIDNGMPIYLVDAYRGQPVDTQESVARRPFAYFLHCIGEMTDHSACA